MTRSARWGMGTVAAAVLVMGVAATVRAQDPVEIGPNIYKKVFENDRVRVSNITFKPGDSLAMHSHPDHFVYVLSDGTLTLTYPDGKTAEFVGKTGEVSWINAETHAGVNTGTTEFRAIVVELKPQP